MKSTPSPGKKNFGFFFDKPAGSVWRIPELDEIDAATRDRIFTAIRRGYAPSSIFSAKGGTGPDEEARQLIESDTLGWLFMAIDSLQMFYILCHGRAEPNYRFNPLRFSLCRKAIKAAAVYAKAPNDENWAVLDAALWDLKTEGERTRDYYFSRLRSIMGN